MVYFDMLREITMKITARKQLLALFVAAAFTGSALAAFTTGMTVEQIQVEIQAQKAANANLTPQQLVALAIAANLPVASITTALVNFAAANPTQFSVAQAVQGAIAAVGNANAAAVVSAAVTAQPQQAQTIVNTAVTQVGASNTSIVAAIVTQAIIAGAPAATVVAAATSAGASTTTVTTAAQAAIVTVNTDSNPRNNQAPLPVSPA